MLSYQCLDPAEWSERGTEGAPERGLVTPRSAGRGLQAALPSGDQLPGALLQPGADPLHMVQAWVRHHLGRDRKVSPQGCLRRQPSGLPRTRIRSSLPRLPTAVSGVKGRA